MSRDFIVKQVAIELESQGIAKCRAIKFANDAGDFFQTNVCNSKDPFKECCDYAGRNAESTIIGFKYKSPKSKSNPRRKKPQEAFVF